MVLSSLFLKEIWNNGTPEVTDFMFATVKRKATKVVSTTKVVTVGNSDDRIP